MEKKSLVLVHILSESTWPVSFSMKAEKFSGAEIEQSIVDGMFQAFAEDRNAGALTEHLQELMERIHLVTEFDDAIIALFQARTGGRGGNRLVIPAKLVDQAAIERLLASPDAALRHSVHLVAGHVARFRHDGQEALITGLDGGLQDRVPFLGHAAELGGLTRRLGQGDAVLVDVGRLLDLVGPGVCIPSPWERNFLAAI